jgi:hypothetical protein
MRGHRTTPGGSLRAVLSIVSLFLIATALTGSSNGKTTTARRDGGDGGSATQAERTGMREEPAPVYIVATRTDLGGNEVKYSYEVTNGSAIPVTAISIGHARLHVASNQLTVLPTGATVDSVPPSSYTSPAGWTFMVEGTEGDPKVYLEWESGGSSYDLLGGHSLAGFSVNVPQADSLYETGWWTAWLGDGGTYEGMLQDSLPVSVPPSSIEAHEGVIVTPSPGRMATEIRFYSPASAPGTVDVFDAQGRLVRRLFEGVVKSGWNDLEWKGDDETGATVSTGTYFLKIVAGPRLRFARVVLVQ